MAGSLQNNGLVLVIDDEKEVRNTVTELLELEGYQTLSASNAQEGLAHLKSRTPSVIVLDLSMPGMSPAEFMAEKKCDPRIAEIPVIVLSADHSVRGKAIAIGADEFFKKPVDIHQFFETMDRYRKPNDNLLVILGESSTIH